MKSKPKLLKAIKELLAIDHRSVPFSQAVRETQKIAKRIKKVLDQDCFSPSEARLREIFLRNERNCLRQSIEQYESLIKKHMVKIDKPAKAEMTFGSWKATGTTTNDMVWRTS